MTRTIVLAAALWGCGQDYELTAVPTDPVVVSHAAPAAPGDAPVGAPDAGLPTYGRPAPGGVVVPDGSGPRPSSRPRSTGQASPPVSEQQVSLGGGARSDTVDFLFVVDDSSSMKSIIDQVFAGFDALAAEGVFPSDARIGVMSTLPANERIPQRVHPAAPNRAWLRFEPGFGDLVSKSRIERFRQVAPDEFAERFSLDGCDPWFAPDATNADGVPCLVAHTQELLYGVNVEAGLTALGQRLARGQLFRTGAAANVIFVSDTHDPGVTDQSPFYDLLVAQRPTGEQLAMTAALHQVTSSFRLHAIAPASQCSGETWEQIGPSYFAAADATGGRTLDLCTATPDQYVDMIRTLVTEGSVPTRPVIPLTRTGDVGEVLVDGVARPYHLSRDQKAVILDDAMPTASSQVTIRYGGSPSVLGPASASALRRAGARSAPTR